MRFVTTVLVLVCSSLASPLLTGASAQGPQLTGVIPPADLDVGGGLITIEGAGLGSALSVSIGGSPLLNMEVVDDSTIRGNAPSGSPGLANVLVSMPAGDLRLNAGFAYVASQPAAGSSLTLDGINDLVEFGNVTALSTNTVEIWTRIGAGQAGGIIVGQLSGPGQWCGFGTCLSGGGASAAPDHVGIGYDLDGFGCGTASYVTSEEVAEQWIHLAGTYDGTMQRLYVNGVLTAQKPTASFQPASWLLAGAIEFANGYQSYFRGSIDEIRLWNHARSAQEILHGMSRPLTGQEPGLVGYWRLDESAGQQVFPSSPGAVTGVLGSSAAAETRDPLWEPSGAGIREPAVSVGEWTNLGGGLAGASGKPALTGHGLLLGGTPVSLEVGGCASFATAWIFAGNSAANLPFKGGIMVPHPDLFVGPVNLDAEGATVFSETWPAGVPTGHAIYLQVWVADASAVAGMSGSNAIRAVSP